GGRGGGGRRGLKMPVEHLLSAGVAGREAQVLGRQPHRRVVGVPELVADSELHTTPRYARSMRLPSSPMSASTSVRYSCSPPWNTSSISAYERRACSS